MADSTTPILQVREDSNGSWYVAVAWSDGRTEKITGFGTELEAKEWTRTQMQSWLEGRNARDIA